MNRITNHTELELEKKRLELLLEDKKRALQVDFEKIKVNLNPVDKIVNAVTNITRPATKSATLNAGLNAGIALLMKSSILGRAGFVTKLVMPLILKKIVRNKIKQKEKSIQRSILQTSSN